MSEDFLFQRDYIFQFIFKTVCPTVILGYSIMSNDFSTQKFLECEYRVRFGLKCCSECDVACECEESYQNGACIDDWNLEPLPFMEDELFESFGQLFAPANIAKTINLLT